jgi:hypothetical protein
MQQQNYVEILFRTGKWPYVPWRNSFSESRPTSHFSLTDFLLQKQSTAAASLNTALLLLLEIRLHHKHKLSLLFPISETIDEHLACLSAPDAA